MRPNYLKNIQHGVQRPWHVVSYNRGDFGTFSLTKTRMSIFCQYRLRTFNPISTSRENCLKDPVHYPRTAAAESFLAVIARFMDKQSMTSIFSFLQSKFALCKAFQQLEINATKNYLFDQFTYWLSRYASEKAAYLNDYFLGNKGLDYICNDFIKFCFKEGILLDSHCTLESFQQHNKILDVAIENELMKIKRKYTINLLGFGLGDGNYEKILAKNLVQLKIAREVKIFGFDPYAKQEDDIVYFTEQQLSNDTATIFDIIVVRWVLHHVHLSQRWKNLINCINRCNPGALILIIEHGFLEKKYLDIEIKLYTLFNAIFDVVANIGIRPQWFTATVPDIGANFFINYLRPCDFEAVKNSTISTTTQKIYDIGPNFPNQTVCSMRVSTLGV